MQKNQYIDPRGIVPFDDSLPNGPLTADNVSVNQEERCCLVKNHGTKLLPCPFCGVSDSVVEAFESRDEESDSDWSQKWLGDVWFRVACMNCGAEGPAHQKMKTAISVWGVASEAVGKSGGRESQKEKG
ncbi:MAG: hypothetical protein EB141_04955 [Verrucomicrobia bacterium]|nr:hypothetical protein [Pseudomonadota bacterium]NDA67852.1 hypothetical protein [Verrucomicrobiota bacterium]NDB74986.1 hypothetical protein [Verrucomicrobiota bacterium]NDD39634.1 hypothetical protein [Verrucomicrobiota bacterium]NDE99663.1 hypothetical protein [Verrucomicrobiota bacterium]